jgi:hypothetical protein
LGARQVAGGEGRDVSILEDGSYEMGVGGKINDRVSRNNEPKRQLNALANILLKNNHQ